jgi:hypothetical protein
VSPEEKALATVVDLLTRLAVPYMITGSVAASFHGRPRATHDADVVIDPTPPQLEQLLQGLADAGFYVSPEGAREALRHRRPFNVIETSHACKIDLIIRRERPFSIEEFARRRPIDLPFGLGVTMVTPEDAVLSKLEWARQIAPTSSAGHRCSELSICGGRSLPADKQQMKRGECTFAQGAASH